MPAQPLELGTVSSIDGTLGMDVDPAHLGPQPGQPVMRVLAAALPRTAASATAKLVADVFVMPEYRARGLAEWLMSVNMAHPDLQDLRRGVLATRDAHALSAKFGFTALGAPIASWSGTIPASTSA